MGLTPEQAHQLAVGTFVGASALASASDDPPEVLRAARHLQGRHHLRGHHVHGATAA